MYEAVEAQGRPHASIVDGPANTPVVREEGESALAIFDIKNTNITVGCKRKVHVDGKKKTKR
jgi:hypothetical protein